MRRAPGYANFTPSKVTVGGSVASSAAGARSVTTGRAPRMSRMPRAAAVPSMPAWSSMRSSRSGRNTSTPSIRMTSREARSIAPVLTRHAPRASAATAPVPQGGRDERDERGAHQHNGHWQVDERDEREDEDRGGYRDDELRQELAEVHLELLDAFHHRRRDGPGALMREVRGPEAHEVVVEPLAESRLHAERGVVRDHRARVFDERPRGDHGDDGGDREQERRQPGAGEHAREEPTEQREPCNAEHDADEPEGRGHDDARPQAGREAEEFAIEVHLSASAAIPG